MNQGIMNLYSLGYSKIGDLDRFESFTNNAFGDISRDYIDPSRISASILYNKLRTKCKVLIVGPDHKEQAERLGKKGINLGKKPKRVTRARQLAKRLG
tara:strand:- start:2794 stop:3087 length:294 start_codon:yes stop_codon:yes gene_type:complete